MQVIRLISLIRYYKFFSGIKIFVDLLFSKSNFYTINSKVFANKIYLRKDQSDPYIFDQIYVEQQYNFQFPFDQDVKWIIDAGANIGLAAIYFSQKFPGAQIISIEPDKENFALLQKNTLNYKNVSCIQAALWYKNEKVTISNEEEKSAGFMVEPDNGIQEKSIPGITVNQLIEDHQMSEISLLKIDIEGSEKEVFLNKSSSWLPKCRCVVTELHDWLKPGTSQVFFKEMSNYNWITYVKGENIICFK